MATHACVFRTICIAGGRSLVGGSVPTFQFTVLCGSRGLSTIVACSRLRVRWVAFLLCWGAVIASPLEEVSLSFCTFIVSQLGWFVKGFLVIIQKFLREVIQSFGHQAGISPSEVGLSPWHHYNTTDHIKSQQVILHKFGKIQIQSLCILSIDKIAGGMI